MASAVRYMLVCKQTTAAFQLLLVSIQLVNTPLSLQGDFVAKQR